MILASGRIGVTVRKGPRSGKRSRLQGGVATSLLVVLI
jgi:hypothetical protein